MMEFFPPPPLSPTTIPFPFRKAAGLPGISAKYYETSYNKTSCKPSFQGWAKQPSRRK